jgi:hypothetical protein
MSRTRSKSRNSFNVSSRNVINSRNSGSNRNWSRSCRPISRMIRVSSRIRSIIIFIIISLFSLFLCVSFVLFLFAYIFVINVFWAVE